MDLATKISIFKRFILNFTINIQEIPEDSCQ